MANDDVMDFINSLGDDKLDALADFLTDYEMLKGWNKLTQKDVADKAGTTQSAISRLERMKGKPAYDLLRRVSEAVGGSLLMTPMGDMTVTLPYDLQDKAKIEAEAKGHTVQEWMQSVLRDELEDGEKGCITVKWEVKSSSGFTATYGKKQEQIVRLKDSEPIAG